MPVFNLTIDDTSPLIQYDGRWSDSSHADDYWSAYSNGTFHATNDYGASATLTFNGSAVYLFGAYRPNHDIYWAKLDGDISIYNGNPNSSTNYFQHLMFNATDLKKGQHDLVLQNKYSTSGASWCDVDYILVTSGDGNTDTQSYDTILDDDHSNITYSVGWDAPHHTDLTNGYFNDTMHRTSQTSASATISFEGNSITIYGATSMDHAAFSVALDGGVPMVLNGSAPVLRVQNMLYYAGGLSNSSHSVTISNVDTNGMWLDLDKVVVSKWGEWDTTNKTKHSGKGQSDDSEVPVGPIIGGVVGGIVLLALIGIGIFYYLRQRRRRGVDRIRTGAMSKEDILPGPELIIEPFQSYDYGGVPNTASTLPHESSVDVSERTPLSPSNSGYTHASSFVMVPSPAPPQSSSSQTASSYFPSSSSASEQRPNEKYFIANNDSASPSHRDLPPPNYSEATASSRTSTPSDSKTGFS